MHIYKVFGPFPVPKSANGQPNFDNYATKAFWKQVNESEPGLSSACGCYVFSVGKEAWYVGLTKKAFEIECFMPHKQAKLFVATGKGGGDAYLHLVARTTPRGDRFAKHAHSYKDIKELESMLIMVALRRNTRLLNKSNTKFLRSVVVPGILNSQQGDERAHPVQSLREVLGVSEPTGIKPVVAARRKSEEIDEREVDELILKPERITAVEAAVKALKARKGSPMTAGEIAEAAMTEFGWKPKGETPANTMSGAIQRNIASSNPLFRRGGRGKFLLADDGR